MTYLLKIHSPLPLHSSLAYLVHLFAYSMPAFCNGLASPVGNPRMLPNLTRGSVPPYSIPNNFRVLLPKNIYVVGGGEQVLLGAQI